MTLKLIYRLNYVVRFLLLMLLITELTGPPNGPVSFCWLVAGVCRLRLSASSVIVVICNASGEIAGHLGGWLPPG